MDRLLDLARAVVTEADVAETPDVSSVLKTAPPELFTFAPPGTDWHADRERCWQAFLANAERVLAAPKWQRDGLLYLYRAEAARRYGSTTAEAMAGSLRGWIEFRAVH